MGKRKEFVGKVISDKMQKTIIVQVSRLSKHPKYSRIIRKYTKFKVHDEKNLAKLGDIVRIRECRPLSKEKHFLLKEIIKKAQAPEVELKEGI